MPSFTASTATMGLPGRLGFIAADNDEGIYFGRQVLQLAGAENTQARVCEYCAAGRRCDMNAVGAGMQCLGLGKHTGRRGNVDGFGAIERDQHDVFGRNRGFIVIVTRGGHA